MALSDTCSDVSWQLASDIVHYLDWEYDKICVVEIKK